MTQLTKSELLKVINFLEYKLYQTHKADIHNETTTGLRKLYMNLNDQLYNERD